MRCKYCNEVIFKDGHKEEDCAMKEYGEYSWLKNKQGESKCVED